MKTVKFHRYAQAQGTELYNDPLGEVVALVPANTWMGITHTSEGWYHVITAHANGWVRMEDCTTGRHLRLTSVLPAGQKPAMTDYRLIA